MAWLGPAFAIAGCLLFSAVILPGRRPRRAQREPSATRALAAAFAQPGTELDLAAEPGPVITDFPIWFAEATRHHALALPNEPPESILDLARSFDPPARLLVVERRQRGRLACRDPHGRPGSECFVPIELPDLHDYPGALAVHPRLPDPLPVTGSRRYWVVRVGPGPLGYGRSHDPPSHTRPR